MKIAVTGTIGSGKSTICAEMQIRMPDYEFFSVDDAVKKLYEEDHVKAFLLHKYGTSDKKTISDMAFKDLRMLDELEAYFSPYVQTILEQWLNDYDNIVVEFPLLFELGYESRFDCTVCVYVPDDVAVKRAIERAKQKGVDLSEAKVRQIMHRQLPASEKSAKANLTYDNSLPGAHRMDSLVYLLGRYSLSLRPVRRAPKVGIVAGSFDPITCGHEYIIRKALTLVDQLYVIVAFNPTKKGLFTPTERVLLIEKTLLFSLSKKQKQKVHVLELPPGELVVSFARRNNANFIFRGMRNAADFEHEVQLNLLQKKLEPNVETVYFMTPRTMLEVSSSNVKSLLHINGWEKLAQDFVSPTVLEALRAHAKR